MPIIATARPAPAAALPALELAAGSLGFPAALRTDRSDRPFPDRLFP